ncbi:protein mono-ADP-ribosyltransferase TIPARP [Callorhinchus milii]|uniref:TCDD inducible poly(ADP-ribose) polymerase n=2 Tax=Callorhinchus milii TaxID=7868 RepID=A0A4W3GDH0_CALMI|nr:protein mono-ADP-ribosyltransferase TIPARP [Callorhinchus milii]XP_007886984.1 protein mono-ADP-ribosyltransferase TIPARP [Callorhinchus milii]|eukprot:gi/632934908/ref/XP_007886976.1/ PREDICTED: TCDD-inducible poly [ADP-ribose] polymerase [Callorhinchus milii]
MEKSLHVCGAQAEPSSNATALLSSQCTTELSLAPPVSFQQELAQPIAIPNKVPLINVILKKKHAQRKLEVRNLRALSFILTSLLRSDKLDGVRDRAGSVGGILFEALKKEKKTEEEEEEEGEESDDNSPHHHHHQQPGSDGEGSGVPVVGETALQLQLQHQTVVLQHSFTPAETPMVVGPSANSPFQNQTCPGQDVNGNPMATDCPTPLYHQIPGSHDLLLLGQSGAEEDLKVAAAAVDGGIFQDKSEEASIDLVFDLLTQLQYHTHSEEGVQVCDEFLQGKCAYGSDCPKHHTVLPYHWQLRDIASHTWQGISEEAQEHLERLYCNPDNDQVKLRYQGRVFPLDLNSMTVYDVEFNQVRRLSTASFTNLGSKFHTVWKYYCREHFGWREYSEAVVRCIEEASSRGMSEICFLMQQNRYILNLREGFQQNVIFGTRRRIIRRPLFRSPILLLPYLQTLAGLSAPIEKAQGPVSAQACFPALSSSSSLYPETWISMEPSQDFVQVPVSIEDKSYKTVYNLFHKTIPETKFRILNIHRVQNPYLWEKYKRKKEYMSRKMSEMDKILNERHLFHGTSQDAVNAICKHNFDPRVCGKHATMFGQGSYFARKASYSHNFSKKSKEGIHYMFLAKLLIGKYTLGKPSMRRPPSQSPADPSSDLFDSCVDNWLDPQIFVIFNDDQSFPYFVIQYDEVGSTVTV